MILIVPTYFLLLNYANNVNVDLIIISILLMVIYVTWGIPITVIILIISLILHWILITRAANKAIKRINKKLKLEGLNVYLVKKNKCPFPSIRNY